MRLDFRILYDLEDRNPRPTSSSTEDLGESKGTSQGAAAPKAVLLYP